MLELGRKEHHLFGGIFVQIALVGLLVFAYTQAVRQLNHGREQFLRLQEQLTVAREQMSRRQAAVTDLAALQGEVGKLKENFASETDLGVLLERIERTARETKTLRSLQVRKTDAPVDVLSFPVEGRDDFEVRLFGLELSGEGTTRGVSGLLAAFDSASGQPLLSLATLTLRGLEESAKEPVQFTLRWLVPAIDGAAPPAAGSAASPPAEQENWGNREEPFLSPVGHPRALRVPAATLASLRLTGVLWDPVAPACVINKRVLKTGEWVDAYQVVLITPGAVILQGLDEEIVLRLS